MNNPVPPITDELGLATWAKEQPNANDFLFTQDIVYMFKDDFLRLKEYSYTHPSALYAGKMWKCRINKAWLLAWCYLLHEPGTFAIKFRKLLYY